MGYLGRRIGLSQDKAGPSGADGSGGGLLDLFASGYYQREGNIYNDPGTGIQSGLTATGGVISDYTSGSDIYRAHIFTSSGTFEVTAGGTLGDNLEYLVVAGGGGGGGYSGANGGGGGGAGGLRTNLSGHPLAGATYPVPAFPTSYTVTIGAGGKEQASPAPGTDGSNSEFYPTPVSYPSTQRVRSVGGGGGGYNPAAGRAGGSAGGGVAPTSSVTAGNTPTDPNHPQPQGNPGGHGNSNSSRAGGGGGGAGGAGETATGSYPGGVAGNGGLASQVLIAGPPAASQPVGTPGPSGTGWFAGGGGGAGADETFPDSKRGIGGRGPNHDATTPYGGGGNGAPGGPSSIPRTEMNALASTGGGGGGGRLLANFAGNGGSGIVVVRYKIGTISSQKATGGNISFHGGKTIHTFLNSGDFTVTDGPVAANYLVVAGGGGGSAGGGGGGAGGMLNSTVTIGPGPYTVTVGAGGFADNSVSPTQESAGFAGSNSVLNLPSAVTSTGGGGGAKGRSGGNTNGPKNGGSGGGGGEGDTSGGTGVGGQGNAGGNYVTPNTGYYGAGGGGAGSAGEPSLTNSAGDGGDGAAVTWIAAGGTPGPSAGRWFAGGGGGSTESASSPDPQKASGGVGGGGDTEVAGLQNTGGGGGGGYFSGVPTGGGAKQGGSGIVIIAYPT
jgi:hypothetical protein